MIFDYPDLKIPAENSSYRSIQKNLSKKKICASFDNLFFF